MDIYIIILITTAIISIILSFKLQNDLLKELKNYYLNDFDGISGYWLINLGILINPRNCFKTDYMFKGWLTFLLREILLTCNIILIYFIAKQIII